MSKLVIPGVGYCLMQVESTYGTFPTLSASDVVYVEEMTGTYTADILSRRPLSPGRPGSMSRVGKRRIEFSCSTELAMPDAYNAATMTPHGDELLRASGFAKQNISDASNEATWYVLQPTNHESISFELYSFSADGVSANELRGRGGRCDFDLALNTDDGRVMLNCTGRALEQATAANTFISNSTQSRAVEFYADKPFLSLGTMHAELVDLSDNTVYGGGTEGTPSNLWQVVSLAVNGVMGVTEQSGLAAAQGVARQRLNTAEPATMSVTIEEAVYTTSGDGVWNPYAIRDAESPIEIRLKSTQTDISGNTTFFCINAYAQIVGVDSVESDGRRLWDLQLELRYPEDAADGAPAVGTSPTQVFDYYSSGGVDRGLFIDQTLTNSGVLCLGFVRVL